MYVLFGRVYGVGGGETVDVDSLGVYSVDADANDAVSVSSAGNGELWVLHSPVLLEVRDG